MSPKCLPGLKIVLAVFKTKYMLRTIIQNLLNYAPAKPLLQEIGIVT